MLRTISAAALVMAAGASAALAQPPVTASQGAPADQTYQGDGGHYYRDCKKSSGTTGALAGAGAGGLGAAALGAGPLGLAAGVIGGGLLGRHLDKKHDEAQNEKNGC